MKPFLLWNDYYILKILYQVLVKAISFFLTYLIVIKTYRKVRLNEFEVQYLY